MHDDSYISNDQIKLENSVLLSTLSASYSWLVGKYLQIKSFCDDKRSLASYEEVRTVKVLASYPTYLLVEVINANGSRYTRTIDKIDMRSGLMRYRELEDIEDEQSLLGSDNQDCV